LDSRQFAPYLAHFVSACVFVGLNEVVEKHLAFGWLFRLVLIDRGAGAAARVHATHTVDGADDDLVEVAADK
jgi:hypothetical protein